MHYRALLVSFFLILLTSSTVLAADDPPLEPVACVPVANADQWDPPIQAPDPDDDWTAWQEYYSQVLSQRFGIFTDTIRAAVVPFYNRCFLVKVGGFTIQQAEVIATLLMQVEMRMRERFKQHELPGNHHFH